MTPVIAARRTRADSYLASNFGEAGAIDFFGPRLDLPRSQSQLLVSKSVKQY